MENRICYGSIRAREAEKTPYPGLAVIGEIEPNSDGSLILRVGRLNEIGWEQTEHLVLTRVEARALVARMCRLCGLTLSFENDVPQERAFIRLPDEARELIEGAPDAA